MLAIREYFWDPWPAGPTPGAYPVGYSPTYRQAYRYRLWWWAVLGVAQWLQVYG